MKTKDVVKMLVEDGEKVSLSTVKHELNRHELKGYCARKKPFLKKKHRKAILKFANAHKDKNFNFWRHVQWSDETVSFYVVSGNLWIKLFLILCSLCVN